jgi:predicted alpha/beta hydrolase
MKMTFQEIRIIATGPCIANQLRDVSTICRRSWYIAAHVWKIYDFKIEVVPFIIDDDEVCFVLDQHTELDFYSASSLKQQSAGRHVAPLGHIILIPSQPVVALSP